MSSLFKTASKNLSRQHSKIDVNRLVNSFLYLRPSDMGLRQMSPEELVGIAGRLSAERTVLYLSALNVALARGGINDRGFQSWLCQRHLGYSELIAIGRSKHRLTQFTPFHFRLALWLVLNYGNRGGGLGPGEPGFNLEIGKLLLHSPDAIAKHPPPAGDSDLDLLRLELELTHAGYRESSRPIEDISVKGFMLTRLLQERNLAQEFIDHYGFSPAQLQTAIGAIWLHFRGHTPRFWSTVGSPSINFEYLMGEVNAPRKLGDFILERIATDVAEPAADAPGTSAQLSQIADRPIALCRGAITCMDYDYMEAKAARTMWNLAVETAKRVGAGPWLSGEAGGIFEEYCGRLLSAFESEDSARSAWLAPPELLRNAAVDALLVEGDRAVIFEMKMTVLPAKDLYGTSSEDLAKAIREKFIVGKKGDRRGFAQLARHLRTMVRSPERYRLEGVKKIIPCLVTMEDALSWPPGNLFAVKEAERLFEEFGSIIGKPVILHSEDLGMLAERSRLEPLSSMLDKISRGPLIHTGNVKNVIRHFWPERELEASGAKADIERPTDFLDMALKYLEAFEDASSDPCPRCGEQRRFSADATGKGRLWCEECQVCVTATEEQSRAHLADIEAKRRRYLEGTA